MCVRFPPSLTGYGFSSCMAQIIVAFLSSWDYYSYVLQWILQKSRIITLLCYSVYALSPLCASAETGADGRVGPLKHGEDSVTVSIVWLKVVLSTATGRDFDDVSGDGIDDSTTILVKKKRAVFREEVSVSPPTQTSVLPISEFVCSLPTFSHAFEVAKGQHYQASDGFQYFSAGLSPPFLRS